MTPLNTLFARYQDALGTPKAGQLLPDLIEQATRHVYPIRRSFPRTQLIDGDRFDDAVQDAILRLTRPENAQGIEPEKFDHYLRSSARHALIDTTRRLNRRKDRTSYHAMAEEEIFGREEISTADVAALQAKLDKAVEHCDPRAVSAWQDHYLAGAKLAEIAQRDGIPENTVKTRVKAVNRVLRNHPRLERELMEYRPHELTGLMR